MRAAQSQFTSESVTEGHPDKLCDQISDAVLDAIIAEDPNARVACEAAATTGLVLVFGEISTGASNALQKASELARRMVTEFGMSAEVGPVSLSQRGEQSIMPGMDNRVGSARLEETIDAEVKRIIETNYARVRQLLQDNRDALETLSRELLDVEDMDGETLERRLEELGAARVAFTPHSLRAG